MKKISSKYAIVDFKSNIYHIVESMPLELDIDITDMMILENVIIEINTEDRLTCKGSPVQRSYGLNKYGVHWIEKLKGSLEPDEIICKNRIRYGYAGIIDWMFKKKRAYLPQGVYCLKLRGEDVTLESSRWMIYKHG